MRQRDQLQAEETCGEIPCQAVIAKTHQLTTHRSGWFGRILADGTRRGERPEEKPVGQTSRLFRRSPLQRKSHVYTQLCLSSILAIPVGTLSRRSLVRDLPVTRR